MFQRIRLTWLAVLALGAGLGFVAARNDLPRQSHAVSITPIASTLVVDEAGSANQAKPLQVAHASAALAGAQPGRLDGRSNQREEAEHLDHLGRRCGLEQHERLQLSDDGLQYAQH